MVVGEGELESWEGLEAWFTASRRVLKFFMRGRLRLELKLLYADRSNSPLSFRNIS